MIGKGFYRHNFSDELKLPWITFNSSFLPDVMVVVCVKIKHHTQNPQSKKKPKLTEQTEKISKQLRPTDSIESSYLHCTRFSSGMQLQDEALDIIGGEAQDIRRVERKIILLGTCQKLAGRGGGWEF